MSHGRVWESGWLDKTVEEAEVRVTEGAEKVGWGGAGSVGTSQEMLRWKALSQGKPVTVKTHQSCGWGGSKGWSRSRSQKWLW